MQILLAVALGTIIIAVFMTVRLPHEHPMSPDFMNGIVAGRFAPLSWELLLMIMIGSIATISIVEIISRDSDNQGQKIGVLPKCLTRRGRLLAVLIPPLAAATATSVGVLLFGEKSPIQFDVFAGFSGIAGEIVVPWGVWIIAVAAATVTIAFLAACMFERKE